MTKTPNYNLPQWEPADPVQRLDFQDAFSTIDAALATIPKIVCGTYKGDGQRTQHIELGFQPRAVLVITQYGEVDKDGFCYGGLALQGNPLRSSSGSKDAAVEITETGFDTHNLDNSTTHPQANHNYITYHYLAIA